jgi:hypothetical protein
MNLLISITQLMQYLALPNARLQQADYNLPSLLPLPKLTTQLPFHKAYRK